MTSQRLSIFKKIFGGLMALPIFLMSYLFIPPFPSQALADINDSIKFTPQVTIPNSLIGTNTSVGEYNEKTGSYTNNLLAKYVVSIYNYGLAIAGILATIVLMGGGVIWLTSGGEAGKISQAKDLIGGSIIGIIILVCAWVILNTVNTDLTEPKSINIDGTGISKSNYCCELNSGKIEIPVNNVKGKWIHASGDKAGQEFISCEDSTFSAATSCQSGETCTKFDKQYFCFSPQRVCCTCETPGSFICEDGITEIACSAKCDNLKKADRRFSSYYKTHIRPEEYDCSPVKRGNNYNGQACKIEGGGEW